MLTELGAAFAELRDDATTRVVIVTGAPPVFSAGADAAARPAPRPRRSGAGSSPRARASSAASSSAPTRCSRTSSRRPSAMINGHAVGGGWGLDAGLRLPHRRRGGPALDPRGGPRRAARRGLDHALRPHGRARPRQGDHHGLPRATRPPRPRRWGSCTRSCPARSSAQAVRRLRGACSAKKPSRPLAEVKARINAIARIGIPEVNAMTEGFLDRE